MSRPGAVALYARISEDRQGDMLGVDRQLKDCRELAQRRGWPVFAEYVDDDVSAWKGRPRPRYSQLLDDIRSGRADGVVVWDLDRLHRNPLELEEFFRVCETAGVRHLATCSGDIDLATDSGQFHARIMGAVAKKESDDKSRRTKRKHLEIAEAGRWAGGPPPYGYDKQRRVVPEQAAIVREMARRLLAGESLRTLARDLEARGVTTARGARWSMQTLRRILMNPGLAGVRTLRGEVVATAVWKPILTSKESARVRAFLTNPSRTLTRPSRHYLLTGFLYCGRCGTKLITRPNHHRRCYICGSGPALAGCGGISILADRLEDFVTEAVLHRLDTPALATALEGASTDDDKDLLSTVADDESQLLELAEAHGNKVFSLQEWLAARKPIEERLRRAHAALARNDRHDHLREVVGHGGVLRQNWPAMNLDQRRSVVSTILDRITVHPTRVRGRVAFDPTRLEPTWKL